MLIYSWNIFRELILKIKKKLILKIKKSIKSWYTIEIYLLSYNEVLSLLYMSIVLFYLSISL